jgi:N-methylhydantoinase A
VPLSPGQLSAETVTAAVESFHGLHLTLFGHSFEDVDVELVNVRVKGFGTRPEPPMWWDWRAAPDLGRLAPRRGVYFEEVGEIVESRVLFRHELEAGESVEGPAVIHQVDSTIAVPPRFVAEALESGSLVLHRRDPNREDDASARTLASVAA